MSENKEYNLEVDARDPALVAAFELERSMQMIPDGQYGSTQYYYKEAIHAAFWAGVNWQRAQKEDK